MGPRISSSRSLGFNSRSRPKLTRVLGRGCGYRPFEPTDVKWLYAAYVFGTLPKGMFKAGLTRDEFMELAKEEFSKFLQLFVLVGSAKLKPTSPTGDHPIGVVGLNTSNNYHVELSFFWLPTASARNKLESSIRFLMELRKTHMAFFFAPFGGKRFYTHLCKYGVLRRVGTSEHHFGQDAHAAVFQTRRV